MYLVVKGNIIICKALTEEQAKCIIKTEKARSERKGYLTNGYKYGKIISEKDVDRKCGWFHHQIKVQFSNNEIINYRGALYHVKEM